MDFLAPDLVPVYAATLFMLLLAGALLVWGGRRGAAPWFAAYLVANGVGTLLNAIRNALAAQDPHSMTAAQVAATLAQLDILQRFLGAALAAAPFLIVVAAYARTHHPSPWLTRGTAASVALLAIWNLAAPMQLFTVGPSSFQDDPTWTYLLQLEVPAFASVGIALLVITRPSGHGSETGSRHLLTLALLAYPIHRGCYFVVSYFTRVPEVTQQAGASALALVGSLGIAVFLLFCAYLAVVRLAKASKQRTGLSAIVVIGASSGIARVFLAQVPDAVFFGVAYLPLPLLATYALLRHNLFGLDVKLRFAIKTSTIAAVFLAVLFVVANIAQNYLGGQYGVIVGGAAAGLLFFVMAPIQRAAEGLAQKAVPVAAGPIAIPSNDRRTELYRRAVRFAIRDGQINADEELHLFEVAQEMGLGAGDAMRLRQEVEREVAP